MQTSIVFFDASIKPFKLTKKPIPLIIDFPVIDFLFMLLKNLVCNLR